MQQSITQKFTPKELVSTITGKGQVTVPIEVRKHLGVSINGKIAFVIEENGKVQVAQAKYPDIQSLRGIAGSLKKPLPWKEVKHIAYEDRFKDKYGR